MAQYREILKDYNSIENCETRQQQKVWWAAKGLTLEAAIRRACLSEIECSAQGKKYLHPHQWRLKKNPKEKSVLVVACTTLTAISIYTLIVNLATFDEIHGLVSCKFKAILGAGPLYAYDVALRIGLHLNKHPDKIYLHGDVTTGARNLLGEAKVKGRPWLCVAELPDEFRGLSAAEAEDVLCIYKNCFRNGDPTSAKARRRCGKGGC